MFVTVKSLTALIDLRIGFVKEAYENKENFSDEVFSNYIDEMKETLNGSLEALSEISSNERLIKTYSRKVTKAFENIEKDC